MELSKRLQAVANLVTPGYIMADIGTDHGYIPIYLIENNIVPSAIAMDINEGPLERARLHVSSCGFSDKIDLRLSDGMAAIEAGEVESAIIAGMGGGLVMHILQAFPAVTNSLKEFVLQPQSEIAKVRRFLLNTGFHFVTENMILEDGKFYPMMKVLPPDEGQEKEHWNDTEVYYGKYLLESQNPVLKSFIEKEITLKRDLIKDLKGQNSDRARERMNELHKELARAEEGMKYYAL